MRALRTVLRGLIWLGVGSMLGGAALFVYVIFVRAPDIDEGGVEMGRVTFAQGQRIAVLESPRLEQPTLVQPRLDFVVHTPWIAETTWEASYGRPVTRQPAFRQWMRMTFAPEGGGATVERVVPVSWETAVDAEADEEASDDVDAGHDDVGESTTIVRRHYRLRPPVALPGGTRAIVAVELLELPQGDLERPIGDIESNLGELSDIEVVLYRDVADVLAHDEFNAEAPMWGLYAALAGLGAVVIAGLVLGRLPAAARAESAHVG